MKKITGWIGFARRHGIRQRITRRAGAVLATAFLAVALSAFAAVSAEVRLAGRVLDQNGKPVAGAKVECLQASSATEDMETARSVTTDSNGTFEFKLTAERSLLVATKTGLAPAWNQLYQVSDDETNQVLTLVPGGLIEGVVVDDSDKPMGGAEVSVGMAYMERPMETGGSSWGYISGKVASRLFSTRAGADGKFKLEGFPTNAAADFVVKSQGKVLRVPKRQYVSPETMQARAGQEGVKLVMEPAGAIEGIVVAETGEKIPGVRILLQPESGVYIGPSTREPPVSGPDGKFTVNEVAAGKYTLHAVFSTNEVADWVAELANVNVETGQTVTGVTLAATRGGLIQARVVSKGTGAPLPGVGVSANGKEYRTSRTTKDTGVAVLRVPAGDYKISAHRDNVSTQEAVTVESGKTNTVELKLAEPPKIVGVVLDPSGTPAAGLEITVFPSWGRSGKPVKTDEKGRFEIKSDQRFQTARMNEVPSIVVRDLTRNLAAAEEIQEGATEINLKLQPGMSVAGKVQDASGKPLPGQVMLYLWSGNSGSQFTDKRTPADAAGKFELTALPPGRKYSIDVNAKGYGSANQQINVEDGRVDLEPFVLQVADKNLAGQVLDSEDKPVSGAWVHMYGAGQPNNSTRSDAKGFFKFDSVCDGSIQVSASAQNAYGNARAEAGDTNVVLKLGNTMGGMSMRETPRRASLKGKPLPDLKTVNLDLDCAPAGKPVLLCLFDVEQRPSRRFIKLITDQHSALTDKGVAVVAVQALLASPNSLKEWKDTSNPPFRVGFVAEKNDKTKWAADVQSLPWLILADGEHRVLAEGFGLEELQEKLKAVGK